MISEYEYEYEEDGDNYRIMCMSIEHPLPIAHRRYRQRRRRRAKDCVQQMQSRYNTEQCDWICPAAANSVTSTSNVSRAPLKKCRKQRFKHWLRERKSVVLRPDDDGPGSGTESSCLSQGGNYAIAKAPRASLGDEYLLLLYLCSSHYSVSDVVQVSVVPQTQLRTQLTTAPPAPFGHRILQNSSSS
jgi:hypothetical protein